VYSVSILRPYKNIQNYKEAHPAVHSIGIYSEKPEEK
jgi:hypothetical protein